MSAVEGRDGAGPEAFGGRDHGRVNRAEAKIAISGYELRDAVPVGGKHRFCREIANDPSFVRLQKFKTGFVVAIILVVIRV